MNTIFPSNKIHHGKNVKCFREMLGIKQEILAEKIGLSQQSISRIENQKKLNDKILEKIAKEMQIPVEAFKNLSEESVINIIANAFHDKSPAGSHINHNHKCTFNHVEKIIELYEQLLKEKETKIASLEQMIGKIKP
jgi:DNA-binding XRE family transcriptional regulator